MPSIIIKNKPIDFQFGSGNPPLKPGRHFLPDELFNQWFVPALIASGDILLDHGQETEQANMKELKYGDLQVMFPDSSLSQAPVVDLKKAEPPEVKQTVEQAPAQVEKVIEPPVVIVRVEELKKEEPVKVNIEEKQDEPVRRKRR